MAGATWKMREGGVRCRLVRAMAGIALARQQHGSGLVGKNYIARQVRRQRFAESAQFSMQARRQRSAAAPGGEPDQAAASGTIAPAAGAA